MEVRILLRSEEYIDRKIFESEQILRLLSLLDEEEVRIFFKNNETVQIKRREKKISIRLAWNCWSWKKVKSRRVKSKRRKSFKKCTLFNFTYYYYYYSTFPSPRVYPSIATLETWRTISGKRWNASATEIGRRLMKLARAERWNVGKWTR